MKDHCGSVAETVVATHRTAGVFCGGLRFAPPTLLLPFCLAALAATSCLGQSTWEGVDKTVVEKFAEEAGRPPQEPYINTDRGDLLLFLFLTAGAVGGFIAGYTFRGLFPPPSPRAPRHVVPLPKGEGRLDRTPHAPST